MITGILNNILEHSKANKQLIGFRKYHDGGDIYVGYVIDYNDVFIQLQHITKYGDEDGILLLKIDDMESFEAEEDYYKFHQYLISNGNKIKPQEVRSFPIPETEDWQYEALIHLSEFKTIITISLRTDDSIINGYILDFDEVYLNFQTVGNLGEDTGFAIYRLADIASVGIGRMEARKRETFYEWRNKAE
jgi:hypothetical protein